MFKSINKYLKIDNYLVRLKKIKKLAKIRKLLSLEAVDTDFNFIWNIKELELLSHDYDDKNEYVVFGHKINLEENINWHKDRFSDFIYPNVRFDKLNPIQWFDKGIELVYPWEQSRFYFGLNLGRKYLITKDEKYYLIFKNLVEDWIEKNSYLYGVNWLSTMDVSIRAVNWIVALNIFSNLFKNDKSFQKNITSSLIWHAEYISAFPLIEKNGLTTNHTTSAYTGLFFLALTLRSYSKSSNWLNEAITGLETCISNQIYSDGIDYEGSIPYHRLVLELFAYSAIVAKANSIKFSQSFYQNLFKMFEFSASYLDQLGNAPQIGDNDSGRLLIFNDEKNNPYLMEDNHSYLLNIGEHIYNYKFLSSCKLRDKYILEYLPEMEKIKLDDIIIVPRNTNTSISFEAGGAYFLKDRNYDLCVSSFPNGQNGKGGHNHLDVGSFTLSISGVPMIVDPGSYCYSKNRKLRDIFRGYTYHNTLFNFSDQKLDLSKNGYWNLSEFYTSNLLNMNENSIEIQINSIFEDKSRFRDFKLLNEKVLITDKYEGEFYSRMNLHPNFSSLRLDDNKIIIDNNYEILVKSNSKININDYEYSSSYGIKQAAKFILFEAKNMLKFEIKKLL